LRLSARHSLSSLEKSRSALAERWPFRCHFLSASLRLARSAVAREKLAWLYKQLD
jgi:hypothetical protein